MSGHLCFPLVTGDGWPASLSPYFMTTLLRDRIGFKGLAVTDDLTMNGADARGRFPLRGLHQGRRGRQRPAHDQRAPRDRRPRLDAPPGGLSGRPAFKARVREAATRVIETKLKYLRPRGKAGPPPRPRGPRREGARSRGRVLLRGPGLSERHRAALGRHSLRPPRLGGGLPRSPGPSRNSSMPPFAAYPGAGTFRFSYEPEGAAIGSELAGLRPRPRRRRRRDRLRRQRGGHGLRRTRPRGRQAGRHSIRSKPGAPHQGAMGRRLGSSVQLLALLAAARGSPSSRAKPRRRAGCPCIFPSEGFRLSKERQRPAMAARRRGGHPRPLRFPEGSRRAPRRLFGPAASGSRPIERIEPLYRTEPRSSLLAPPPFSAPRRSLGCRRRRIRRRGLGAA